MIDHLVNHNRTFKIFDAKTYSGARLDVKWSDGMESRGEVDSWNVPPMEYVNLPRVGILAHVKGTWV